jgi:hypothetical protein
MPIALIKSRICREFVFSKSSFSVETVKYKRLYRLVYLTKHFVFFCVLFHTELVSDSWTSDIDISKYTHLTN